MKKFSICSVQFGSVMYDFSWHHEPQCARPPCLSQPPEFTQTHVHSVDDAIHHLILCHPLLLHFHASFWSCYQGGRWLASTVTQRLSCIELRNEKTVSQNPFMSTLVFLCQMFLLWPTSAGKKNDFASLLWHDDGWTVPKCLGVGGLVRISINYFQTADASPLVSIFVF